MAALETKLDKCLGSIDQATLAKSKNAPLNPKNSTKNAAAPATKISFGPNKLSKVDILCQISANSNPKMTLKTISQLLSAGKNVMVRQHIHSSIPIEKANSLSNEFSKLCLKNSIKINKEPGRAANEIDFIFTFLITNKLAKENKNVTDISATIHAAQFTSIFGDQNVAELIFDLAGGKDVDEDDLYWVDMISEALADASKLKNVKNIVDKNFENTGGFGDIAKMCL